MTRTRIGICLLAGLAAMLWLGAATAGSSVVYRGAGTWTSDNGTAAGTWKAELQRSTSGDALTGSITVGGATTIEQGIVVGTMNQNDITFGVLQGGAAVAKFSGSLSGESISGTYRIESMSDAGAWDGSLTETAAAEESAAAAP